MTRLSKLSLMSLNLIIVHLINDNSQQYFERHSVKFFFFQRRKLITGGKGLSKGKSRSSCLTFHVPNTSQLTLLTLNEKENKDFCHMILIYFDIIGCFLTQEPENGSNGMEKPVQAIKWP